MKKLLLVALCSVLAASLGASTPAVCPKSEKSAQCQCKNCTCNPCTCTAENNKNSDAKSDCGNQGSKGSQVAIAKEVATKVQS